MCDKWAMTLKFKEQTALFMGSDIFSVDVQYSVQQTIRIEMFKIRAWKLLVTRA